MFSATDTTAALKKFDVPTLIPHGDVDQIVPIGASATPSSKLVKNARLKVYKGGAPHVHDAEGSGERQSAGIHQGIGAGAYFPPTRNTDSLLPSRSRK